jgi:hypothetical protein
MRFKSFVVHARWKLTFLGVFTYLLAGCSGMTTEPVAEAGLRPDLAATYTLTGRATLGSHTNLLDADDDDDFEGPVALVGAVVRVKDANGFVVQNGSTNSGGDFQLQASNLPAQLEFVLGDESTYMVALGSVDAGTTVVRSKLEYQGGQRVMNGEIFPDDDLNAVKDDGIVTQVLGRRAGDPNSGYLTTSAAEQIEATARDLQSIVLSRPGKPVADKVEDVLGKTQTAAIELAKTRSDMQAALGSLEGAVGDLEAVVKDGLLELATGTRLMDQLAVAARQVATKNLDQAIARARYPDVIRQAQQALAEGDSFRTSGRCKDAMGKYKEALSKAQSALS